MLEKKVCDVARVKLFEDGSGGFMGYGSSWGNKDRAGEIVVRGAFAKSLESFVSNGFIAVGHDWGALPVATVKSAVEDDFGLKIEAEFHSTPAAQEARRTVAERLERGKSVGLSIGYRVLDAEDTEGGRLLKEIELHEVSLVTVPCNPLAAVAAVKDAPDSLAGLTLADHADSVLAAVEASLRGSKVLRDRWNDVNDLRAKEGRVLSGANRDRIAKLRDLSREVSGECQAMLDATEPAPKGLALDDALWLEAQQALVRTSRAARAGELP